MNHLNFNKAPINCQVLLPLSKSILNRILVINSLSGEPKINGLDSEAMDVTVMQQLLNEININTGKTLTETTLNVGNAGTVMRFLTALLAVTPGKWLITGSDRMQQRPVRPLTDALQSLGADLKFDSTTGYPPIHITGNQFLKGGSVNLDAGISSQFISALMMIGPLLKGGLNINLQGEIISGPYIRMTQSLMQKCGANIHFSGDKIEIQPGGYQKTDILNQVEPDWSAAAFWYQVAAFVPHAHIVLKGLSPNSVQGDSVLPEIFEKLGVTSDFKDGNLLLTHTSENFCCEFNYDYTACPDLAQAVIVTCAALGVKGRHSGLKTLRVKETDRIAALQNELKKLGYRVEVSGNDIFIEEQNKSQLAEKENVIVKCYDDHRMAMSFATLALLRDDIYLDEPEVVVKSYPRFWRDMQMAGIAIHNQL